MDRRVESVQNLRRDFWAGGLAYAELTPDRVARVLPAFVEVNIIAILPFAGQQNLKARRPGMTSCARFATNSRLRVVRLRRASMGSAVAGRNNGLPAAVVGRGAGERRGKKPVLARARHV